MATAKKRDNNDDSGWWFDRYQYDYREHTYSRGSGTRSWMSKLGYYDDGDYWGYSTKTRSTESVYQDLLNQLQNSANLIGNDENGGRIKVRWSNGNNVNGGKDYAIYLSPDGLMQGDKIDEEMIDGMTGKVYLASTLRETVDPQSFMSALAARKKETQLHRGAVRIWESIETSIARDKILNDWSGFSPYISNDAKNSSASKEEVQAFIDSSVENPTIEAATTAIAWNLLNPADRVRIPDCYDACLDAAADALGKEVEAKDRFNTCFRIASKIASILPPQEEEDQCNNEGEEKGEGTPKVCDGSLLGDSVENETDANLAEMIAKDSDDSTNDKDIKVFTERDELDQDGKDFVFLQEHPTQANHTSFIEQVRKCATQISSIRSSLAFRNNDYRFESYGHRRGEIDENSLYKIKMNDDRVMSMRDEINSKRISICLLVDESGSMGGSRVRSARDVAITLAEGMRGVNGIDVSIYGHTAECERRGCTIREYFTPRNPHMASCMRMQGRNENHDGFAIMHTANTFFRDYGRSERKIMFVISDGQPAGSRYGGNSAMTHVKNVSDSCRKNLGIEVYGIGIDSAYTESTGSKMYGDGHFVVLQDVVSSLPTMARFIRQVAMKMKV